MSHSDSSASSTPGAHRGTASARARGRGVYIAVVTFYLLLFAALIWPTYPVFATIEPRILELPHSLAYVVEGLLLSFFVLLGLYLWEEGRASDEVPTSKED